jgi:uncharacterized protein (TIGR02246 family)
MTTSVEPELRRLYEGILRSWNARDAAAMAAAFAEEGSLVGFDGSQADGRAAIRQHLAPVFADHPTARYLARVREVRSLGSGVALLRAVAGMVPPRADDLKPELNTIHTLVAVAGPDGWRAALFQSTPAAWHGRAQDSAALTDELRATLRRGAVCE